MKLKLIPTETPLSENSSFIIKGGSLSLWATELNRLEITPSSINVYPLPGATANSIWGCLVEFKRAPLKTFTHKHQRVTLLAQVLFVPEYSKVYPVITAVELQKLMRQKTTLLHPELGLVELTDPLHFPDVISTPEQRSRFVTTPETGISIPTEVRTIHLKAKPAEEVLKDFEEKEFPKKETLPEKPLNPIEKVKLSLYKLLFKSKKQSDDGKTKKTSLLKRVTGLFSNSESSEKAVKNLQQDFEELEARNESELNKLLDMLKKNPEEALKYAVPLDNSGRGNPNQRGEFRLNKFWENFSLFGSSSSQGGGGGGFTDDNAFLKLNLQYTETAKELIKRGEHKKAAFIYLKLIKNYSMAASTLEKAGYYSEAGSIYLKHAKNTLKAAECFEKGHLYEDAIEQYKVNQKHEKVGDLYLTLNDAESAHKHYEKTVAVSKHKNDYCYAAHIQKTKLEDTPKAQETLLTAWNKNIQQKESLSAYIANVETEKDRKKELDNIHKNHITSSNYESFIMVMKVNYSKNDSLSDHVKELSLETIAAYAKTDVHILEHLSHFTPSDTQIKKDVIKHTMHNRPNRKKKKTSQ